MIELTTARLQNAIAKARAESKNLVVRMTGAVRMYRVESKTSGQTYTVNFFVRRDGKRFGSCTCKAGQNDMACKHIAAAAALNTCLAAQGAFKRSAVSAVR